MAKHLLKKAGYDNGLTVTLYTSLAVNSSALNMATVFKQQASAVGVTVNLNQVSASDFFGPNYYTKVPFSQIYYDYSPYLCRSRRRSCPRRRSRRLTSTIRSTPSLYYEANKTQSASVRQGDRVRDADDRLQPGRLHHSLLRGLPGRVQHELTGYQKGKVGEPLGNFNFEDYSFLS